MMNRFARSACSWIATLVILCLVQAIPQPRLAAQDEPEAPVSENVVDFAKDILPLLKSECQSCHQGDNAKAGFLVLDRDSTLGYIEPGDAESSSLWTDYLRQPSKDVDPESLVMPPDGPLSADKLALLKLWIDEGAHWSELDNTGEDAEAPAVRDGGAPLSQGEKVYRAMGYFHPAVVHFPIALLIVAGMCAFLSYFLGSRCESMAFHLLWIGATSSIIAVAMGWSFAEQRGYPDWNQFPGPDASAEEISLFYHGWLGCLLVVLGMLTVMIGLLAGRNKASKLRHVWKVATMLLALLVSVVGHHGGELVYGNLIGKAIEQLRK